MNSVKKAKRWLIERLIDVYHYVLIFPLVRRRNQLDAYTVILPVIPEFYAVTEYNLRFLSRCDLSNCHEVIVITDSHKHHAENRRVVARYADKMNIRLVVQPFYRRLLMKIQRRSFVVHTMNFITAIKESRTKYVYLHDGDFFLTDGGHIERIFAEGRRDKLDMLSTYSRPYSDYGYADESIVFPATFELLIRRDFMTSSPAYKIFAGEVNGKWHGNFTNYFLTVRNDRCRMLDTPGGDPRFIDDDADRLGPDDPIPVGLHFKHLFERYWKFRDQGTSFDDGKYTMFFLYMMTVANPDCEHQYFPSMDVYLKSVKPVYRSNYYGAFERYFLQFIAHDALSDKEREMMRQGFEQLQEAILQNEKSTVAIN